MNELDKTLNELLDKQFNDDLFAVMNGSELGRRFIESLIVRCGQNSSSFTGNSQTFYNEGSRGIALMLERKIAENGLVGMDLLHKAEREYLIFADDIRKSLVKKQEAANKNRPTRK